MGERNVSQDGLEFDGRGDFNTVRVSSPERGIHVFSLVKDLGLRVAAKQEAIPFLISFGIAEFFFKFKSFALECVAFLAVWFVLSFVQSLIFPHARRQNS